MKKLFTLFIVALSVNIYAQNYVPNPDFEGGDAGWINSGGISRKIVSPGHDGSTNAYQIEGIANKGVQYVTDGLTELVSGDYELSFWAKGVVGQQAKFKVVFTDGSMTTVIGTAFKESDTWEQFSKTVSLDATVNINKFVVQAQTVEASGAQTFVVDDLFFGVRIDTYSLTTSVSGPGTISPSSGDVPQDSDQTITAIPYHGYEFSGWGGDLSGATNPATLTMDADKSISATFTKKADYETLFEWNFNTDTDAEGWTTSSHCSVDVAGGNAVMSLSGDYPKLIKEQLGIDSDVLDVVEIRIKNNTAFGATDNQMKILYWDPTVGRNRNIGIANTSVNDSEFKVYRIPLGGHEYWNGIIESISFMGPSLLSEPTTAGTVEIDYIKLLNGNKDATLSSMTNSVGTLSPAFSADVSDYTLSVPSGTQVVNFSALATVSDKSTVTVRQMTTEADVETATVVADGNIDVSLGAGKASILVEAENGMKKFYVVMITVETATSIDDNLIELSIYPNPLQSTLNIKTTGQLGVVEIYSLTGQKVYGSNTGNKQVDVAQLDKGVYIVSMVVDGEVIRKKVTKQ
ncbi:T9SS type A sorting domain-containing protein [Carboxylicivirga sp. M1479]|uniref:InlB B-repeat-containing protein n=1 Tax=Carboxylicivirga sp. M1479 TaxID=2594476 RepID=UPI0011782438|nr:T9SS type A sorting domain-containing protein [Carboxylicivirga sp. M1479]TRX71764.1 T9SS type A sorting domain-containing protein [Carboxylicivirga sp. M1479]